VKGDVDYRKIAADVFLTSACRDAMKTVGQKAPEANAVKHTFMLGKTRVFDPDRADDYLKTFAIRRA
jgi:nitrate/nitrite transport system substrate-binding protein